MIELRAKGKRFIDWEPAARIRPLLNGTILIAGFVAFMARRPGVLAHPTLFAEDGQILLLGSLKDGFRSLGHPYNGYVIVGSRFLAVLASFLPLAWTPATYSVMAAAVAVGSCGVALRLRASWALSGWVLRAVVFLALLLIPQVAETHAVLTNIVWWAGIGLMLVAICDDPLTAWGRVGEAAFVIAALLTGPVGIVLAPMILWRLWRMRTRWTLALTAMWGLVSVLQLVILKGQHRKVGAVHWGFNLASVGVHRWFGPFSVGSTFVQNHLVGPGWTRQPWWLTLLLVALVVLVTLRARDRGAGVMILAVGLLQVAAGFLAMGPNALLLPDRYTVGAVAGIVLIAAIARPADWPSRIVHIVLIVVLIALWPRNVRVPSRTGPSFQQAGNCLEHVVVACAVPAIPEVFSFQVHPGDI